MNKNLLLVAVLLSTISCKKQDLSGGTTAEKGFVVTTFAGNGTSGFANGNGISTQFSSPVDIAVDAAGNLYVADVYNERIRKITQAGVVSTFAGDGNYGFVEGNSASAEFRDPIGLTVDAAGNVYVADYTNQRIRKATAAGQVFTVVGDGTIGFAEGTGTAAKFNYAADVAVDAADNLYIADQYNHRIRKVTPAGVTSTLAGSNTPGYADGTGAAAQLNFPGGVAVDNGSGNIYITDVLNNNIRKITSAGEVTTLAGSSTAGSADGKGTLAQFKQPRGIAIDATGNLYVADYGNHLIRKITPDGTVSTIAGSGVSGYADGIGKAALFNNPSGVAVDAAGNIFVTDYGNHRIRKIVYQ